MTKKASTNKRTADGLVLDVELTLEGDKLALKYDVQNTAARDVYLLNRLYRPTPMMNIDPNIIYIHFLRGRDTIWLHKKIHDIPSDRNVLAPVSPFCSPVRAGAKLSETVSIPVPMHEYREYLAKDESKAVSRTYQNIYFSLGYYWSVPGTTEPTKKLGGVEVVLPQLPPGTKVEWGVAETAPMALEVPVVDPT